MPLFGRDRDYKQVVGERHNAPSIVPRITLEQPPRLSGGVRVGVLLCFALTLLLAFALPPNSFASSKYYQDERWDQYFRDAGRKYGINPMLLKAIAIHESGLNPNIRGELKEYGLMQILPSTAKALRLPRGKELDPESNILFGAKLTRENADLLRGWDPGISDNLLLVRLIAAHNSGAGNARQDRYVRKYVSTVLKHYRSLGGGDPLSGYQTTTMNPLPFFYLRSVTSLEKSHDLPQVGDSLLLHFEVKAMRSDARKGVFVIQPPKGACDTSFSPGKDASWKDGVCRIKFGSLSKDSTMRIALRLRPLKASQSWFLELLARCELFGQEGVGNYPLRGLQDRSGKPCELVLLDLTP